MHFSSCDGIKLTTRTIHLEICLVNPQNPSRTVLPCGGDIDFQCAIQWLVMHQRFRRQTACLDKLNLIFNVAEEEIGAEA